MIWPMQMGDTVPGDMECGRRLLPWKQVGSYFWGGQSVEGQYQTDGRKRSPPPTHLLLLVILMKGKIFVQLTEIILYWWVKLMFERSECCLVYFLIRIFIYLFIFLTTATAGILLQWIQSEATMQKPLQSHFYFDIMWGCSMPSDWFNAHARHQAKEPRALGHEYLVK